MRYIGEINIERMTEAELDYFYRIKATNNRKSLLPLFVYFILKGDKPNHFTQNEIIDELKKAPYEINVERKAVGRTLHLLSDAGIGIIESEKNGFWYDKSAVEVDISSVFPDIDYDEPEIDFKEVEKFAEAIKPFIFTQEYISISALQRRYEIPFDFSKAVVDTLIQEGVLEEVTNSIKKRVKMKVK